LRTFKLAGYWEGEDWQTMIKFRAHEFDTLWYLRGGRGEKKAANKAMP